MRFLTTSLLAILAAVAISACSSSTNGSDASGSTATSSADNSAATSSADTSGSTATSTADNSAAGGSNMGGGAAGSIPSYPGAKTEAAGSSMAMGGNASGKVMSTADSFDKVYAWYQKNMPAGSEKAHTDTPIKSAVFMLGEAGATQQSVTITVAQGKTMITVASVKK